MATIRYTHGFNLLHQFVIGWGVVLIGGIALAIEAISILEPLWESVSVGLSGQTKTALEWVGAIAIWLGCLFLLFRAIVIPLSPLPTFLYLRLWLFVPASWEDAKQTAFLFDGDLEGKWYPLRELRRVPKNLRVDVLYEFADRVQSHFSGRFRGATFSQDTKAHFDGASPNEQQPSQALRQARNVLGVGPNADADEIRTAYLRLIKKYHPDIYASAQPELRSFAEEKAKELNAAYAALSRTV